MYLDAANVEEGAMVAIASVVEQEENAQIYVKSGDTFVFFVDLSGATGIQGETGSMGPQGPRGEAGENGQDGYSPTIEVKTNTTTQYILTITDKNGSYDTPNLKGSGGGEGGNNGATFTPSVSEDGIISWTNDAGLDNPEPVNIKGPQGEKGDKGDQGEQGPAGQDGAQGPQGIQGPKGDTGEQGPAGADGHTPVKGTDYFTDADKTELVNAVLAAIPNGDEVSY